MTGKPRVVVLVDVVSPYRVPVFRALSDLVDLQVLALARRDRQRGWGPYGPTAPFPLRILPILPGSQRFTFGRRPVHLNRSVRKHLRLFSPDVVIIGGWNQPAFFSALARPRQWKAVIWVESTSRDERSAVLITRVLKQLALRNADAFVVPGKASADHLAELGVRRPVHVAPNAVDTAYFRRSAERSPPGMGDRGGRRLLAFVGLPQRAKGIDIALAVVAAVTDAYLIVLGDSPERSEWEAQARRQGLGARVRFEGDVPPSRVAAVLADAELLLFPSRSDPWGLVVNEAQAAGCPVMMSPFPGAADDLAADGAAYVVELDTTRWITEVRSLLGDRERLSRMAEAGIRAAANFSPEACARGLAGVAE